MKRNWRKGVAFFIGVVSLSVLTGCIPPTAIGMESPSMIESSEMLAIMESVFPFTEVGKSLFITTGRYTAHSIVSYEAVFMEVYLEKNIPPCAFKAATVFIGELHQRLDGLIAAGYAMSWHTPWFVVFLTNDCGQIRVWGFDPLSDPRTGIGIWEIKEDRDVLLVLI